MKKNLPARSFSDESYCESAKVVDAKAIKTKATNTANNLKFILNSFSFCFD